MTTYNDTPFYLTVTVNSVNGDTHAANPPSFVVEGYLNGTILGQRPVEPDREFVRPDFADFKLPQGTIASFSSGGSRHVPRRSLSSTTTISSPDGVPGGLSIMGGVVAETAAPEPASFVVLALLGLAQVGAVRWRNRRRRGLVA